MLFWSLTRAAPLLTPCVGAREGKFVCVPTTEELRLFAAESCVFAADTTRFDGAVFLKAAAG